MIMIDRNSRSCSTGLHDHLPPEWMITIDRNAQSATILAADDRVRHLRPAPSDSAVCCSRHDRRIEVEDHPSAE
jgi:hypothetical protein